MKRQNKMQAKLNLAVGITAFLILLVLAESALCLPIDQSELGLESDSETYRKSIVGVDGNHQTGGNTYYVSVTGSNGNPGTEALPFRTITQGVSVLNSGDTLYIREGIYTERVDVTASGSPGNPITIKAYPGEYPIIDAENTLPGQLHDFLFILRGDYITLAGLEIRNVFGIAVFVRGNYNTVRDMRIHHTLQDGILVAGSGGANCLNGTTNSHNVVEDNEIWMASLRHEGVTSGGSWTAAISVARCPEYTIVRRNTVYNTWGTGIQVYESMNTTIEDNITFNNQLEHIYINNAPYTTVQGNLSYNTPDNTFLYDGEPGVSIAFCDETYAPVTHDVTIINNLTLGGGRGFFFFNQQSGSGLKNFLIANNTFVDSYWAGISIRYGDHENVQIYNNIISGPNPDPIAYDNPAFDFSHNLWTHAPPAYASSPYDVIGDPHLSKLGSNEPGLLDFHWFELLSYSPAIDAGMTSSDVLDDFDNVIRPRGAGYDMGAFEFVNYIGDLRITDTDVNLPETTYTLRWTAPAAAVTYSLRSSNSRITLANWDAADEVIVPFLPSTPGSTEWLTTTMPYTGDIVYFALRFQDGTGTWSEISNNAYWPAKNIYLPIVYQKSVYSNMNNNVNLVDRFTSCFSWAMLLCLSGYIMLVADNSQNLHVKLNAEDKDGN